MEHPVDRAGEPIAGIDQFKLHISHARIATTAEQNNIDQSRFVQWGLQ